MSWLSKFFGREADAGVREAYPPRDGKKPIQVTKIPLVHPCTLVGGDVIRATLTDTNGRVTELPPHTPGYAVRYDHGLKIEVEDEFGVDVGVGWMLGGKRL